MPRTILDVSKWQGSIDWDKVKASGKIDGVMLRVLGSKGGKPYLDPYFAATTPSVPGWACPWAAITTPGAVTQRQTEEELAALKTALRGKTFQLPLAIDVEDPRLRALAPAKLSALVAEAAAQLEAWGLYAMVYTYTNFADTALDMAALAAYDLWIADYRGKRPARRHGMWQYTSSGKIPGVSGPVDLSHAYKGYAAIIQRAGLTKVRGA